MALDINEARAKMEQAEEHLSDGLKKLRTGRANVGMLEGVSVEVYGAQTPLNHISTISVLDSQTLQIQPFDPNNLAKISASIRDDQSLGLNPSDDGRIIRIPIPPMTQERRLEVVKVVGTKVEEANIALRNIRHDVLNTAKKSKTDGDISEDDMNRIEKQVSDLISEFKARLDEHAKNKEAEIMKV